MVKAYCGYIKNEDLLKKSASGGAATALSLSVLQQGGVVYGVAYASDFKSVKYIRVDNFDLVKEIQGSKYLKASVAKIFGSVEKDLKNETKVLFIGLPCDVAALKRNLESRQIDSSNLITIDLICHGPTFARVADIYLSRLEKKFKSSIKHISVRYKKPNWVPPYLFVSFENGKRYCKEFYKTDYGIAFSTMQLDGCYHCKFKGDNHVSDITIGDYWGIDETDVGYNELGTSILFVHNEKGENFIFSLHNFSLFDADLKKALQGNPMYSIAKEKNQQSQIFKKNFEKKGLSYAVSKELGFFRNIKRKLPSPIVTVLKKIKNW